MPRLFIGSSSESLHLARALQSDLDETIEVRVWNQDLFRTGSSTLEDLLSMINDFDFAVFIWSSDDSSVVRGISHLTPRDNIIFEAGMFYAALGRERVFLLMPKEADVKVPSDLAGINHLRYREPSDKNYRAAVAPSAHHIVARAKALGAKPGRLHAAQMERTSKATTIYQNVRHAWKEMKRDCYEAETIAIIGIRGLSAFGTDQSLVSLAEMVRFPNLRKVRILLLGQESRWLSEGFIQLRAYESIETFRKELRASHDVVESAMAKLVRRLDSTRSGVRYHLGEPKFGLMMTDRVAYVNTYAETPDVQVVDLPIHRFERTLGSLYGAFKRHFDDLWHNDSVSSQVQRNHIDLQTSAGGIVIRNDNGRKAVALLKRDDGYWVLPKGQRMHTDPTLEETALREVSEETGLGRTQFYIDRSLGYYTYDETAERLKISKIVHLYLMRCRDGVSPILKSPEFADAKWWSISDPLPEMLYTYQKSYLHEVIKSEAPHS